jgi:hypothetical protein
LKLESGTFDFVAYQKKPDLIKMTVGGNGRDLVLGYDGETWIERRARQGGAFFSHAPNHRPFGRPASSGPTLRLDGNLLFASAHAVHRFNGSKWSTHHLTNDSSETLMLPEHDAKAFVAVARWPASAVHRYRDGNWSKIDLRPHRRVGHVIAVDIHIYRNGKRIQGCRTTDALAGSTARLGLSVFARQPRQFFGRQLHIQRR